ncbi:hypothetical protein V8B55DRAFT_1366486 [Mucor lusitanicus]|uniref:Wax synthase domain-containing protein n=2 Tax=Mucor circinelloides f. lusitanicus TaxID=29924 RepID=A0A168N3D7_MUCCL|nr:hypothetical protein FB192DRAFT_1307549 [Mucor lusitanicus]OAD05724.1 hypothetical protein MUCCIDRAFT_79195 [Mucor lusitanicus CBS 277.49]
MNEYQVIGKGRTVLPVGQFAFYTLGPMVALYTLATVPTHVLGTRIKQALSLPLMACLVTMPYLYMDKNDDMFCVLCQALPFAAFQRLTDIYWIHPFLYKKDAYLSASDLNAEMWSCIRRDKKVDTKTDKQATVKDKKFYHLFAPILLNALAYDICITYLKTFTSQDVLEIQKSHPWQAFVFFWIGITFMTVLFNMFGSIMQLIYCIGAGRGSYASNEWRNLMNYPFLSISLEDLWSHRWHRIFRAAWVSSAFKPVYYSIRQITNKSPKFKHLAIGLANLAVFVASGITHEYIVLCNAGWTLYTQRYMGQEMTFFVLHGVLVVVEKTMAFFLEPMLPTSVVQSPIVKLARHVYVIYISYITFPWFINSFAPWGLFKLPSFTPLGPVLDDYLAATPYLLQYCGSLVKL